MTNADRAKGDRLEGFRETGLGREGGVRRSAWAVLLALILLGSALAVAALTPDARAAHPFRSLRIGEFALTITTFNPMLITFTDEFVVVYNTYSTLLTWDKNYHSEGDLAYSWSLAPDNLTWTLQLVHSAYFVDPTNPTSLAHPVTAADVAFTYTLQMSQPASIFSSYVSEIQSVSALDAYTVQIVTRQPFAAMFTTLATIPILPQYIWSVVTNPLKYSPSYPIGSGAMYYDSANSTASLLVLRKSPSYYGPAYYCRQVRPDEVRFISYTSTPSMVNDFLSGASSLDAIEGIDPTSYTTQLASWSPKWGVDEGFVGEFSINAMTGAERNGLVSSGLSQFRSGASNQILATNLVVRRAIAMSINKTTLTQDALLGLGHVADTLVPDSNPWHYSIPTNRRFPFNTSAARAMLNAAGWKYDSTGALNPGATPLYQKGTSNSTVYWPLIFRFYTLKTGSEWQVAAQDIVGWLAQAGIQTTDGGGITVPGYGLYSLNQMSSYWLSGDYDMWLWDWVFSGGSDPSLDILSTETTMAIGPTSDNFYSNSTYDALYNQSLVTIDPVARRTLTDTMQDMIYQYASYILPYYRLNLFAAGTARWTNWGDWSASPGLAPDSDLPNLWFQVEPIDNRAPSIAAFPAVFGENGTATALSVVASDPDGDPLSFTWTFGDGSAPAVTTTPSLEHIYSVAGNYTLAVTISDGEWLACGNSTAEIVPYSPTLNQPPTLTAMQPILIYAFANGTRFGLVDRPSVFVVQVQDPEGDPVYLTWHWGDGSSLSQLVTGGPGVQTMVSQAHNYTAVGSYTVFVVGTDNQTGIGNHTVTESATGVLILSDAAPPVTTADLSGTLGQNGWYVSSVRVTLNSTDDMGVLATAYSVNGGPVTEYTGPFSLAQDGTNTVQFASIDLAFNIEIEKTVTIQIDTTRPSISASVAGTSDTNGWYVSAASVTLTGADQGSGIASMSYAVDGGSWTTYTGPLNVAEGTHSIQYRATDLAGNTAAVQTVSVKVDTTAPTLTNLVPSGRISASSIEVTWTGTDAGSGIAGYAVSVDGGPFQDVGLNESLTLSLADGTHTITVRATDAAGNTVTQTTTVTVDTNLFSFTGPYVGLPTIALIVAVAALLAALVWMRRRRKAAPLPPAEPPVSPPP